MQRRARPRATPSSSGFQYFDTAPHYGFGLSEKRLGAALHDLDPRQELIVSTKAGRKLVPRPAYTPGQQRQGFVTAEPYESEFDYTYDSVMRTYEDSLRRLQREHIDILYVHDIGRFAHGDDHPQALQGIHGWWLSRHERASRIGCRRRDRHRSQRVGSLRGSSGHMPTSMLSCSRDATRCWSSSRWRFSCRLCAKRGVRVIVGGPYNSGILATGVSAANGMGKPGAAHYNYSAAAC